MYSIRQRRRLRQCFVNVSSVAYEYFTINSVICVLPPYSRSRSRTDTAEGVFSVYCVGLLVRRRPKETFRADVIGICKFDGRT